MRLNVFLCGDEWWRSQLLLRYKFPDVNVLTTENLMILRQHKQIMMNRQMPPPSRIWFAAVLHIQCRLNCYSENVMQQRICQTANDSVDVGRAEWIDIPFDIKALLIAAPPFHETSSLTTALDLACWVLM